MRAAITARIAKVDTIDHWELGKIPALTASHRMYDGMMNPIALLKAYPLSGRFLNRRKVSGRAIKPIISIQSHQTAT